MIGKKPSKSNEFVQFSFSGKKLLLALPGCNRNEFTLHKNEGIPVDTGGITAMALFNILYCTVKNVSSPGLSIAEYQLRICLQTRISTHVVCVAMEKFRPPKSSKFERDFN